MFDPYQTWLGIPREQQPPNHYRLLGISPQERDRKVIEEAMIRQMSRIRIYQGGPHARLCSDLLNQIAEAGTTLQDPLKRTRYDEQLRQPAPAPVPSAPPGPPPPIIAGRASAGSRRKLNIWPGWPKLIIFAAAGLY